MRRSARTSRVMMTERPSAANCRRADRLDLVGEYENMVLRLRTHALAGPPPRTPVARPFTPHRLPAPSHAAAAVNGAVINSGQCLGHGLNGRTPGNASEPRRGETRERYAAPCTPRYLYLRGAVRRNGAACGPR